MANTPNLNIDKLTSNINSKVIICGLKGAENSCVPLVGFVQEDLQLSTGNEYTNLFESEAQQKVSDMVNRASAAVGAIAGKGISNFTMKSFEQTIKTWTGSQVPSFPITLTFIALRPDDDVLEQVKTVLGAVSPTRAGVGMLNVMKAPLGYAANGRSSQGTLMISIGKWFRAKDQIITSATFTISQQVISSGKPLYAIVNLNFQPFRAIDYSELKGYFR